MAAGVCLSNTINGLRIEFPTRQIIELQENCLDVTSEVHSVPSEGESTAQVSMWLCLAEI